MREAVAPPEVARALEDDRRLAHALAAVDGGQLVVQHRVDQRVHFEVAPDERVAVRELRVRVSVGIVGVGMARAGGVVSRLALVVCERQVARALAPRHVTHRAHRGQWRPVGRLAA